MLLSILIFIALTNPALAVLEGQVVRVIDGDTLIIKDEQQQEHRIRLVAIDAPERGQACYRESKAHLEKLAQGQRAQIEWRKRDRYGRIVGKMTVGGVDVGLEQIRKGFARHYKKYEMEQSEPDRQAYGAAEGPECRGDKEKT